jgi:hypothetical protein
MEPSFTVRPDTTPRSQPVINVLKYFKFDHLPPHLQAVSRPFGELALKMCDELPECAELTVGLRKLLEAKDCCVRAKLG